MAPGSCSHHNLYGNPLVDHAKDELAGAYGPAGGFIAGSASPAPESTPSHDPTPVPPLTLTIFIEKLIQLFMETYAAFVKVLEQNQAVINNCKSKKTPAVPAELEESKELKSPQYSQQSKISKKKSWKEKKKQRRLEQACKQSILAFSTNATSSCGKVEKDFSNIVYFNYGKTENYADKCHKPR